MLIEDFNVRIPASPCGPSVAALCFCGLQSKKEMDTHTFLQMGVSSEVQLSGMDDDGSSEGNFILASPIAAFKVFGTA
ncbi:MAG TPA: hypothetical protein VN879_19010 [Candidatus Acidoferrales bacterium]|nr:hypothetical protein [Candidatus Acidoferrales bacterium]